jgi:uroporphyrinogen-III synthase
VERIPEQPEVQSRRVGILEQCRAIIVTSPYAAELLLEVVARAVVQRAQFLTPGAGTGRVLQRAGCRVRWPETGGTSEDLLRMPVLRSLDGGVVGIVGAPGGRRLLDRELLRRGTRVERVDLYRRRNCPPGSGLADALESGRQLVVLLSSIGGFEALDDALSGAHLARWRGSTFIVSSERVAERCRRAGVGRVVCADGASDSAMLATLDRLSSSMRINAD